MGGWTDRWMNKWKDMMAGHESIDGWTNGIMDGKKCMDMWMDGRKHGCIYRHIKGRMNGLMKGLMDESMHRRIDDDQKNGRLNRRVKWIDRMIDG